ncbi:MAG: hypothetical protein WC451_02780 [Patescibacteria group bacterium]
MVNYELTFADGYKTTSMTLCDSVKMLRSAEMSYNMREILLNFSKRLNEKNLEIELPKPESLDLCAMDMQVDGNSLIKIDLKAGTITRADGQIVWADKNKNNRRFVLFEKVYRDIQLTQDKATSDPKKVLRFPVIGMQWTSPQDMKNHKVCILFDKYLKNIELFEDEDPYVELLRGKDSAGALQVYYSLSAKEGYEDGR